jgi:tellurite resistance protein
MNPTTATQAGRAPRTVGTPSPSTPAPTAYVGPEPADGPRLAHFPVTFFAVVMGLAGFSLAWARAHATLGAPAIIGQGLFWISLAAYAAILAAYTLKWIRYPEAVREEVSHPVRMAFVPTASIGLLLLAAAGREVGPGLAAGLWWVGVAGQLAATLIVLTAWINRPVFAMAHVSPAWFIPVVGNLTVPLAGVSFGPPEISWFFWSAGLTFWGVLLPVVMSRLFVHEAPVPARLLPTLAILIAPPAVAFVGLQRLEPGVLALPGRVLYYAGAFFALLFLAQLGRLRRLPFFLSWWAYSFPLAALTVSTMMMSELLDSDALADASWVLLSAGSALVILLVARTTTSMLRARICVPE